MTLPVLVFLTQALSASPGSGVGPVPPDSQPVRVWLGSSRPFAPGEAVRVYVETATDGNLLVFRAGPDGHIEVLFPADPSSDVYVRAGTYEIRRATEAAAFEAGGAEGTGVVLAALSPDRFRLDEFVRAGRWNPDALVASWAGANAVAALTDIAQRMVGDGYFNYDFVTYTVAARRYALQPAPGEPSGAAPCPGCGVPAVAVVIVQARPVFVCDPFLAVCDDLFFHRLLRVHPFFLRQRLLHDGSLCDVASPCTVAPEEHAIALAIRPTFRADLAPRGRPRPRFVLPRRPPGPAPIAPRSRGPEGHSPPQATVAVRTIQRSNTSLRAMAPPRRGEGGIGAAVATGRVMARTRTLQPTTPAAGRELRLVMPRIRSPSAPREAEPPRGLVPTVVELPWSRVGTVAVGAPPANPAPQAATRAIALVPATTLPARGVVLQARARPAASSGVVAAHAGPRTMVLPRGARAGVGVGRSGSPATVRRH